MPAVAWQMRQGSMAAGKLLSSPMLGIPPLPTPGASISSVSTACAQCCVVAHLTFSCYSSPLQAYIDFEIGEGNREGARELYERLLQRTRHVKVGAGFVKGLAVVGCCRLQCTRCIPCSTCSARCYGHTYLQSALLSTLYHAAFRLILTLPCRHNCRSPMQVWLSYAKFEATPCTLPFR